MCEVIFKRRIFLWLLTILRLGWQLSVGRCKLLRKLLCREALHNRLVKVRWRGSLKDGLDLCVTFEDRLWVALENAYVWVGVLHLDALNVIDWADVNVKLESGYIPCICNWRFSDVCSLRLRGRQSFLQVRCIVERYPFTLLFWRFGRRFLSFEKCAFAWSAVWLNTFMTVLANLL